MYGLRFSIGQSFRLYRFNVIAASNKKAIKTKGSQSAPGGDEDKNRSVKVKSSIVTSSPLSEYAILLR
jgi:hypothetical protein